MNALALVLLSASTAQASTSPVALAAHGRVRATAAWSTDRTAVALSDAEDDQFRLVDRRLRLDWTPIDGVGLWAEGSWATTSVRSESVDTDGIDGGVGARGALWIGHLWGVGLTARGRALRSWQSAEGERTVEQAALLGDATVSVLLGPRNDGVYAWVGAQGSGWLNHSVDLIADDRRVALTRSRPVGLVVGAELHSDDLRAFTGRAPLRLSAGGDLRTLEGFAASLWVGCAWGGSR